MTRLQQLHSEYRQSPWLDNLERGYIRSGELARLVDQGVRGLTSNPTIFQKAIAGSQDYDQQFGDLVGGGRSVEDAYWELVTDDISDALALLRPIHDESGGVDGFVSVELDPGLARDSAGSADGARELHRRISAPNLFVKIPGTAEGLPAIEQMIAEGHPINITLLFSLDRYQAVMEAYLRGLERAAEAGLDLAPIRSVASFFVSRVDTEVDQRLEAIGTERALSLRGRAAVAQAQVAYARFRSTFSGPRWEALAAKGAEVQRPLWASTSTKNEDYPDTLYVDSLIGPDTVNTLTEETIEAFMDHGTLAMTVDADLPAAHQVLDDLAEVGVDLADVAETLEEQGVASFSKSFDELLTALESKADDIT